MYTYYTVIFEDEKYKPEVIMIKKDDLKEFEKAVYSVYRILKYKLFSKEMFNLMLTEHCAKNNIYLQFIGDIEKYDSFIDDSIYEDLDFISGMDYAII